MRRPPIPSTVRRLIALGVALGAGALPSAQAVVPSGEVSVRAPFETPTNAAPAAVTLEWRRSLNDALFVAGVEFKPVLVLFSSPTCGWCERLKEEVLPDPKIQELLTRFILAEVDVTEDLRASELYQIKQVPVLVFLTSNEQEVLRLNGFVGKADLRKVLDEMLEGKVQRARDTEYNQLLEKIRAGVFPADQWPRMMAAFRQEGRRAEILKALMGLAAFPRQDFVKLLEDRRLAVRLGALEVLEELTGDDRGFDPWLGDGARNVVALEKWRAWAAEGKTAPTERFAVLTNEIVEGYLRDLVSEQPERARRAMGMLERGGPGLLARIDDFQAKNPLLNESARARLREMRYTLRLPSLGGVAPSTLAHRLVYGKLDVRLKTIRDIGPARKQALPILKDFLAEREPMYRETAIDTLVNAGGLKAVPILEEHLRQEKDANVIYTALRDLSRIPSKRGLNILCSYLNHPDEDLVVVALQSIAKLKSDTVAERLKKCLADPRWRVRVAALETTAKLSLKSLGPEVEQRLDDPDGFVRISAVSAVADVAAKDAARKLEELFIREDALKAPVIKALDRLDAGFPPSLAKALEGKDPETLLGVIEALNNADRKGMTLLQSLSRHNHPDVRNAALRILGRSGMENLACRKLVVEQMRKGDRTTALTLLQSIRINDATLSRYHPGRLRAIFADAPAAGSVPVENKNGEDLFNAFSDSPRPALSTNAPAVSAEDLFAAFSAGPGSSGNEMEDLVAAVRGCAEKTDEELRLSAAALLCHLGEVSGVPPILASLGTLTTAQKLEIAGNLERLRKTEVIPLFRQLLRDPAEDVRKMTVRALFERGANEKCINLVFEELTRPGAALKAFEVYNYNLRELASKGDTRRALRKWTETLLASTGETLPTLGLVLLGKTWKSGDEPLAEKFLGSKIPWQRRAAAYALGRCEPAKFRDKLGPLVKDPSEYVRVTLAALYCRYESRWAHYFDEKNFETESDDHSYDERPPPPLPDEVRSALNQLTGDPSIMVRFETYYCLLTNYETFDLTALISTLESMPDQKTASERIGDFLKRNYRSLGPNCAVLLPYVESHLGDKELDEVYQHFGVKDREEAEEVLAASRAADKKIEAGYVTPPAPATAGSSGTRPLKLIYFDKPGCPDCARVAKLLEQLKESFPNLVVENYNINKRQALLYNEALCERFAVPEEVRLVAPSVFCGGGYLIKEDITMDRLAQSLMYSSRVPLEQWYFGPEADLKPAGEAIHRRFQAIEVGVVVLAGLLDGINPCAFATIIFFLSYLQVARRTSREILQIGFAYVLGVFLAYFVLGLGLVELIVRLTILKWAGTLLNWTMGLFSLVVMVLNIRDGIYCLQGRLKDISLQLPDFLKLRIHGVIRTGVRHRRFVIMAFGVGIVISFLELVCTGQVYAPTIVFMVKAGSVPAVGYLLLYNVAFIVPLLMVFGLAYGGLRSETLTRFLQHRAALVKFGTALLFLLLFLFLAFGQRLLAS